MELDISRALLSQRTVTIAQNEGNGRGVKYDEINLFCLASFIYRTPSVSEIRPSRSGWRGILAELSRDWVLERLRSVYVVYLL